MNLQIREIKSVGEDKYEVSLIDERGQLREVVCRVFTHKGVVGITIEPDLVMSSRPSEINGREIATAIIDYHRRRQRDSTL